MSFSSRSMTVLKSLARGFAMVVKAVGRGIAKAFLVTVRFIGRTIKIVASKIGDRWEIRRQKSRIKAEKARMRAFKLEIGEFYWDQCELGNIVWDMDIDDVCCNLLRSQRSVAICEGIIADLKEKVYQWNIRLESVAAQDAGDTDFSPYDFDESADEAYAENGYVENDYVENDYGENDYAESGVETHDGMYQGDEEPERFERPTGYARSEEAAGYQPAAQLGFKKIEFSVRSVFEPEEPEKTLFDFAGLAEGWNTGHAVDVKVEAEARETEAVREVKDDAAVEDEAADRKPRPDGKELNKPLSFEDLYVPYGRGHHDRDGVLTCDVCGYANKSDADVCLICGTALTPP